MEIENDLKERNYAHIARSWRVLAEGAAMLPRINTAKTAIQQYLAKNNYIFAHILHK